MRRMIVRLVLFAATVPLTSPLPALAQALPSAISQQIAQPPIPMLPADGATAERYLAVRLTNGSEFYNSSGGGQGGGSEVSVTNFPAVQPISGAVAVSNLPATQPVSGSVSVANFPATQAVTGSVSVSGGVSVSNFPGTQPVSGTVAVSNFPASQPVSGAVSVSNFPGTQPISGSVTANLGTLNGAATNAAVLEVRDRLPGALVGGMLPVAVGSGTVDVGNFPSAFSVSNFPATQSVSGAVSVSNFPASQTVSVSNFPASQPVTFSGAVSSTPSNLCRTDTAAAGLGVTSSLTAPGAGLFHYITHLEIAAYSTAARTGGSAPVLVTSSNWPGNPVRLFSSAAAVGTTERIVLEFNSPIKASVANTTTSLTAPGTASVIWRINTCFYTGT